nr:DUF1194 domain-containing protein [Amylibacter sp.]
MKQIALPLLILWLTARAVTACEVALVVALDVSRSVDSREYELMRDGIASAFVDDEVLQLIKWMPGGVMVTVTQWGGAGQQQQVVDWLLLQDKASVVRFVEKLLKVNRGFERTATSVSEALIHAETLFGKEVAFCRRRVIDMSGDGISNDGPQVVPVSVTIGRKGVTINGLVVSGAIPDPVNFYIKRVIRGPFSFVEVANSYADYPRAMKRKLLRELVPRFAALAP